MRPIENFVLECFELKEDYLTRPIHVVKKINKTIEFSGEYLASEHDYDPDIHYDFKSVGGTYDWSCISIYKTEDEKYVCCQEYRSSGAFNDLTVYSAAIVDTVELAKNFYEKYSKSRVYTLFVMAGLVEGKKYLEPFGICDSSCTEDDFWL